MCLSFISFLLAVAMLLLLVGNERSGIVSIRIDKELNASGLVVAMGLIPSPVIGVFQTLPVVAVMMLAILILLVSFAVSGMSCDLPLGLSCGLALYVARRVQVLRLVFVVR